MIIHKLPPSPSISQVIDKVDEIVEFLMKGNPAEEKDTIIPNFLRRKPKTAAKSKK